ncbi:MAG: glycogen/starch/alpha-glucan phosphorylase, partial [Exiguobacterium sp.]|nr:glycogen/starch/alpha-glucan phosphorylase [Exiguobacterium sp.]
GSHSTNGVAQIHTDILKQREMRHLYEMFPLRFNNKTNGITHRRWLLKSNPRLSNLITDAVGPSWIEHPNDLEKLMGFSKDASFQEQVMDVKQQNKLDLASYIQDETGITVDPNSIFDVQVKRLHAYKRQLMNALHIHALYQKIKADPTFTMVPRTFIFGAKAAPGYYYAKEVIRYINALATMINHDKRASQFIKIVFLENYRVSMAERIFPGSDVSEQISTASYEASGTGNMKFMMNGALTIGTLDGANIEIRDAVGDDHIFIFGLTPQEVMNYKKFGGYHAADIYHANQEIRDVVDGLVNGTFDKVGEYQFQAIFDSLLVYNDDFLVLKDFASYMQAQRRAGEVFADKARWAESSIVNTAKSGIFSSDRTITEYANAVWNIKPTRVK